MTISHCHPVERSSSEASTGSRKDKSQQTFIVNLNKMWIPTFVGMAKVKELVRK